MNDHDQKLIDDVISHSKQLWEERIAEFCTAIGINSEQYDAIVKQMPKLKERPFFNTPLARDAFVFGYVESHKRHTK